jgi:hypothetical protein
LGTDVEHGARHAHQRKRHHRHLVLGAEVAQVACRLVVAQPVVGVQRHGEHLRAVALLEQLLQRGHDVVVIAHLARRDADAHVLRGGLGRQHMGHAVLVVGVHHADAVHAGEDLLHDLQRLRHVGVQRGAGGARAGVGERGAAGVLRIGHRGEHHRDVRFVQDAAGVLGGRRADGQHQVRLGMGDAPRFVADAEEHAHAVPEAAPFNIEIHLRAVHDQVAALLDALGLQPLEKALQRLLVRLDVGHLQHFHAVRLRLVHLARGQRLHGRRGQAAHQQGRQGPGSSVHHVPLKQGLH